jgi:6-phosphofructokinase 1
MCPAQEQKDINFQVQHDGSTWTVTIEGKVYPIPQAETTLLPVSKLGTGPTDAGQPTRPEIPVPATPITTVVDALDRLHTTAESHKRVIVLEVMGRHAGWIALYGGMAGGADVILLPEIPFNVEAIAKHINERDAQGKHSTLVVVAEGAHWEDGEIVTKKHIEKGQDRLGGIGERVANAIEELTGKETRSCTLGHLQRGGSPTALDRILGLRFGVKAVQLIKEGDFGKMVSYQQYQVGSVPIADAVCQLRTVSKDSEMVLAARAVGTSFGDE